MLEEPFLIQCRPRLVVQKYMINEFEAKHIE